MGFLKSVSCGNIEEEGAGFRGQGLGNSKGVMSSKFRITRYGLRVKKSI